MGEWIVALIIGVFIVVAGLIDRVYRPSGEDRSGPRVRRIREKNRDEREISRLGKLFSVVAGLVDSAHRLSGEDRSGLRGERIRKKIRVRRIREKIRDEREISRLGKQLSSRAHDARETPPSPKPRVGPKGAPEPPPLPPPPVVEVVRAAIARSEVPDPPPVLIEPAVPEPVPAPVEEEFLVEEPATPAPGAGPVEREPAPLEHGHADRGERGVSGDKFREGMMRCPLKKLA